MTRPRLDFDVILDEWPARTQGEALWSLIKSRDVIAARLPLGFVGLKIVSAQILLYVEAGRLHVRQVLPARGTGVPVLLGVS